MDSIEVVNLYILLPGRSYGNQDYAAREKRDGIILLPGRSYGNQDSDGHTLSASRILLPGRSYGNQDRSSLASRFKSETVSI